MSDAEKLREEIAWLESQLHRCMTRSGKALDLASACNAEMGSLKSLLARCRKVLGDVEWGGEGFCQSCGRGPIAEVHADDCELAALLREIPHGPA